MALAHKGLPYEAIPVKYTDKSSIAFSNQDRVPVLVDEGVTVSDSWAIACHLEQKYQAAPALLGGDMGRHFTRFIDLWATRSVFPHIVRLVLFDALNHLDPVDADYVRSTRERQLGIDLATLEAQRGENIKPFNQSVAPLRSYIRQHAFLGGETPSYADYTVFSLFQWARMISSFRLIEIDDPIFSWRSRMLGLFDGLAANVPHDDH